MWACCRQAIDKPIPKVLPAFTAFLDTLGKLGWSDGRNISVEVRWPGADLDQIRAETVALAETAPDVFVVSSNAALDHTEEARQVRTDRFRPGFGSRR